MSRRPLRATVSTSSSISQTSRCSARSSDLRSQSSACSGLPQGADFPSRSARGLLPFELPSIAVVGTGKPRGRQYHGTARPTSRSDASGRRGRHGRGALRAGGDHGATDGRRPRRATRRGVTPRRTIWRPRLSPVSRPLGAAGVEEGTGRGRGHIRTSRKAPRSPSASHGSRRLRREWRRAAADRGRPHDRRRRWPARSAVVAGYLNTHRPSGRPRDRDHGGTTVRGRAYAPPSPTSFDRERGSS